MKILIVGAGGREHALAWRLAQSPLVSTLLACPGNPGIAHLATCLPQPDSTAAYADLAAAHGVDLTIVGPEAPLVDGIVDHFYRKNLRIIGPTQGAARLEGSKIFAKQFFQRAGIPTARSVQTSTAYEALDSLRRFSFPLVIKADGLAGGKGVVIAHDRSTAESAIQQLGPVLVIEEFLEGEEVSFIGLSDGTSLLPFAPTQDHKQLLDSDRGPNTGGMGAYCDTRILTPAQTHNIMDRIMLPTLYGMRQEGTPFTGFLYAGLMLTATGPKVLEFNVRLGDPETQCLMLSYGGDFAALLNEVSNGAGLEDSSEWPRPSVCVVMAAEGYPDRSVTGRAISGISEAEATGAIVFQAGTRKLWDESLVSAGGRVLGVSAHGETLGDAQQNAYAAVSRIIMEGSQYRRDIAEKGLGRW